ncbi:MAG TPA: hypothetical protein VLX60_11455 [Terriglobales bacterium]|nr:hypothetical protein [Terriglobales bacterium]
MGAALHAASGVEFLVGTNIEINPEAVGADFEFEIAMRNGRIGLEENFGNVAVPEMIATPGRIGVGKHSDGTKAAAETKEESYGSPEEADFGFAMRVGIFALPVGIKNNGRNRVPRWRRREAFRVERVLEANGSS